MQCRVSAGSSQERYSQDSSEAEAQGANEYFQRFEGIGRNEGTVLCDPLGSLYGVEEQTYMSMGGFETVVDRTENLVNAQDIGGVELMVPLVHILVDGMRVAYEETMEVPFTGKLH
jgi:hypothetical protein